MRAAVLVGAHDVEVRDLLGLVRKRRVLPDQVDDVGAKAVDAPVEPEAQHVVHRRDDLRVAPVQVGLLGEEQMEVPLRCRLVPGPGGPAERRTPVVRRLIAASIAPDIPGPSCRASRRARLAEPGMLRARVVRHPIEHDAQPSPMGRSEEAIEAFEVAEDRVDGRVVAHVVSEVGHRRPVDRGEPDRVDTEPGDVVKSCGDAGEIPDAVAVGVRERAGIDLVDDRRSPPRHAHSDFAPFSIFDLSTPPPTGPS